MDSNPDQAALQSWFSTNLPSYPQIIQAEVERVKSEIRPQVDGILQAYSSTAA